MIPPNGAEVKLLWIGSCSLGGAIAVSRIRCGKQSIGGTVKPLHRTFRVTEMTDQFTGRAIDVDPFEIIKLVAGRIENLLADHDANEDALTVEYVAAHDQTSSRQGPCAPWPGIAREIETPDPSQFPTEPGGLKGANAHPVVGRLNELAIWESIWRASSAAEMSRGKQCSINLERHDRTAGGSPCRRSRLSRQHPRPSPRAG